MRIGLLSGAGEGEDADHQPRRRPPAPRPCGYHPLDQSIFLDNDYLIKGVAGAMLWRLLREYAATGRTEFTTRELRLDPALRLPTHAENFDARLILLRKRLEERDACLRIVRSGRGRFRLRRDLPHRTGGDRHAEAIA